MKPKKTVATKKTPPAYLIHVEYNGKVEHVIGSCEEEKDDIIKDVKAKGGKVLSCEPIADNKR